MPAEADRKRDTPKSNQDARKHSLYSKVLREADRLDFELAAGVNGIDDEIALLRVTIKSILEDVEDPKKIKLLVDTANALERLIRTRYKITKEQKQSLKEAIGNVLRDVAMPLGVGIGTAIKN